MKKPQAKGYIFESVIWALLRRNGYIKVESSKLRGRGADHQIDAHGVLAIPTPFIYPVRLICEAKCYTKTVELRHIRNFVGVIKDISENYIVGREGDRNTPDRYTDAGCFFSASPYDVASQEYAWAHNIFLISFNTIPCLSHCLDVIEDFVNTKRGAGLINITVKKLVKDFWAKNTEEEVFGTTTLVVGVLDGVYPIVLAGEDNWIQSIDRSLAFGRERIDGIKTARYDIEYGSRFDLSIDGKKVNFVLPAIVAHKIIHRIKETKQGNEIFEIDVPHISIREEVECRRFFKIIITLPEDERKSYFSNLQATVNVLKCVNRVNRTASHGEELAK